MIDNPSAQPDPDAKVTASDLLGSDTIGDGDMVTNVIMVVSAVDMATGVEGLYVIEDDDLTPWKRQGMLFFALNTLLEEMRSSDDE